MFGLQGFNMNIEEFRNKIPQKFIDALNFKHDETWKSFMRDSGATVTEELKLIHDEEWNELIKSLNLKNIQARRLKIEFNC